MVFGFDLKIVPSSDEMSIFASEQAKTILRFHCRFKKYPSVDNLVVIYVMVNIELAIRKNE